MQEEPLCVLTYVVWKRVLFIGYCVFMIYFASYRVFVYSPTSTFGLIVDKYVGSLLLVFLGEILVDLTLFKEVRLYKDRIAKTWALLGTRQLALHDAAYSVGWGGRRKATFRHGMRICLWIPGLSLVWAISYDEYFVREADAKRMNAALARVSGREVEEYEETGFMSRLMKRGPADDAING